MQVELWQIISGLAGTALITWGANRQAALKNNADLKTRAETAQERLEENNRLWQDVQVKQERTWRLESEIERMKDQKECDQRVDVLRERYDGLRDKYDALAEKHSDQRIIVHDLRNELAVWKLKTELGGTPTSENT